MAVPWPGTLQQNLNAAGFSVGLGENRIRTEMDAGPPKMRARTSTRVDEVNCQIWATQAQLDDFKNFYEVSLGAGVLAFEFVDPTTNATEEFRFKSPPEYRFLGTDGAGGYQWSINMIWEKLP